MGWCSGTELFDEVMDAMLDGRSHADQYAPFMRKKIQKVILAFEDKDWDCQPESRWYQKKGPVREAFMDLYPEWFEDEE